MSFNVMVDDQGLMIDETDEINVPDFDPENNDEGPIPAPPLSDISEQNQQIQMISVENWEEGCNAKYQAYQKLRTEKDKLFEENKVFKKYRQIWRGLKRCHKRATQPNKLTEYEIPTDLKKYNRIIEDFDPAVLFQEEYA